MEFINNIKDFFKRQKTNFKVMIFRDSLLMASGRNPQARARNLGGYEGIYLERLGANSIQIGLVNGILSLLNVILSVPSGWLVDRTTNIKKLYFVSFIKFLKSNWPNNSQILCSIQSFPFQHPDQSIQIGDVINVIM